MTLSLVTLKQKRAVLPKEIAVDLAEAILSSDLVGVAKVRNRTIVWANPALHRITGYADGELIGQSTRVFYPDGETYESFPNAVYPSLRSGVIYRSERAQRRKDGSEVWLQFNISELANSQGTTVGVVIDVTDRKKAEKALADERALLEQRVSERTQQVRRLASELEAAEIRERRQIARDLHDDLGQTLAVIRIRLSRLCESENEDMRAIANQVSELVAQADRSMRSLAAQLIPSVLYELGLLPALEWLSEEIEGSHGLSVVIEDDSVPKALSQGARSLIYRAVRELLINVAKHAQAKTATVRLGRRDGSLIVTVSDKGVGFDSGAVAAKSDSFGLASIRERMAFIGGSFELRSSVGAGTEAILTVPLSDDNGRPRTPA